MKSKKKNKIKWLSKPEKEDYPSAASYLSLIFDETQVKVFVAKLKKARVIEYKAKDIFRASRLSLLGVSNRHVKRDLTKIRTKAGISPLLLVRNSATCTVVIADGYHRLCAVYSMDEDAVIPCKII